MFASLIAAIAVSAAASGNLRLHFLHNREPALEAHFQEIKTLSTATSLTRLYPNVQVSVSSFTDKPLPFLGYGDYGNFQSVAFRDYCFAQHAAVSADLNETRARLASLPTPSLPEKSLSQEAAVFDALLRLLASWDAAPTTAPASTSGDAVSVAGDAVSAAGDAVSQPLDVVVVTTNTWSHAPGDAQRAISQWNADRHYGVSSAVSSWGGFGSELFGGVNVQSEQDQADWTALAQCFRQADSEHANPLVPAALMTKFGPFPFPPVSEHETACERSEYPEWSVIRSRLQSRANLRLVFALANPPLASPALATRCSDLAPDARLQCLQRIYHTYIADLDLNAVVVAAPTAAALSATLTDAVVKIVDAAPTVSPSPKQAVQRGVVFGASLAAASGAVVTSLLAGLLVWQRFGDNDDEGDAELTSLDPGSPGSLSDEEGVPVSRARRADLAFRGFPLDDFSPVEPLDATPRTDVSLLDQFF
eukprot:Gregarina_sp_Pseudo_9__1346@NODE_18_length_6061_cov_60_328462_g16_i0_p2_GENE_NODE_18_length_6061_cov_60_328462_g16_i0NODE_18_length_6061_cov_60_328462_g16_i0_p2_ORF_typecomplete_len477_score187_81Integrin_beta/PF00362_18/0_052Integrin_beta/PF00362_18/4_3e02DUF5129/PF17173_4/0_064DUF5129/PF17173_4/3_2e02_NODE_18_length_6061_cov_60_328462_g16_i041965626